MATVTRHVLAPIEDVFEVLLTPDTYPHWLAGCQEIRAVDSDWPAIGSRFHHRVGLAGPLTIADHTKIVEIDAPDLLVLEVRARPLGRGRSEFRLVGGTDQHGRPSTRIALDEVPIGALAPLTSVLDPLIRSRNIASLNALVALLNSPGRAPAKAAQAGGEHDATSA